MIEHGKISPLQFAVLVFMFALGSAVILLPAVIVSIAREDAWISLLLGVFSDILFITLWVQLSKRFPDESIIQFSERILGPWLGKLVGIIYISFFLYLSALVLRNIGGFISTNVLVRTPTQFVHMVFMITIIYSAYLGLEVISRVSEALLPWIIIIFLLTMLLLLPQIDLSRLLPILPNGLHPAIKGVYPLLGFPTSELVVFLMIFPFIKRQDKIRKYFIVSILCTTLFGAFIVMISITVLGVDITARRSYSIFEVAKEIKVGKFFERVEILVGGIWIMTIFVKLAYCFYAANLATAQLLRLKNYRVTILPYSILVVALSMLVFRNPAEFGSLTIGAYPIYAMIHAIFIPVLLLIIAKIRKLNTS